MKSFIEVPNPNRESTRIVVERAVALSKESSTKWRDAAKSASLREGFSSGNDDEVHEQKPSCRSMQH